MGYRRSTNRNPSSAFVTTIVILLAAVRATLVQVVLLLGVFVLEGRVRVTVFSDETAALKLRLFPALIQPARWTRISMLRMAHAAHLSASHLVLV